ncbi:MAG: methyltransferase, partial [Bacteroidales bacterium]|nr:methyltransferase [Bacteroidales bacterium]
MKLPSDLITPVIRSPGSWYTEAGPGTPFRSILKRLQNGQNICLTGTYGFAMSFYAWLKKYVEQRFPVSDYPSSRRHRKALFTLQSRIWISFRDHFPELMKSPANPWISAFYPETGVFLMTFTDYLGMNGAWQWFQKGIQYPVLNHLVHPFYGTYFPSRYDHLTLFDRWVPEHRNFRRVLDIGCGCGILSFILLKHGIREIHATDINPNAVFSFRQDIHRVFGDGQNDLFIEKADLLGSFVPGAGDLILFNPPWIPEPPGKELDRAT